jgi:uncharacterized protein DUF4136
MKRLCLLSIMLLFVAASSAIAQDVRFNFDKSAPFSTYKTYKWVKLKDATPLNDILDGMIKSAFDAELAKKGLTKTDAETANLFIGYQGAVGQEKQFTSYSTDWGYGGGWGRGWYGGGGMGSSTTTGSTSTIYVGQLALDMYDSAKHNLVWRGLASKTIDQKAKPEKQQKNLAKAVTKMLKNYPPPAK